ncbi:hypothetical protein SEA_FEFFERHEAD_85 [Mycobacterium phage Fefferhead]|nr:hypothetical protein SEA_FEFFERHEAD_85 [Mycobacterium phage Fefferhead]
MTAAAAATVSADDPRETPPLMFRPGAFLRVTLRLLNTTE